MTWSEGLWIGRNDGTVVALPLTEGTATFSFSFPEERPVLSLAPAQGVGVGVWAVTENTIGYIAKRAVNASYARIHRKPGAVVCLLPVLDGVWLVQCCIRNETLKTESTITTYDRKLREIQSFVALGQIYAASALDSLAVVAFASKAIVYRDGQLFSTFPIKTQRFSPVAVAFNDNTLLIAAALLILHYDLSGTVVSDQEATSCEKPTA